MPEGDSAYDEELAFRREEQRLRALGRRGRVELSRLRANRGFSAVTPSEGPSNARSLSTRNRTPAADPAAEARREAAAAALVESGAETAESVQRLRPGAAPPATPDPAAADGGGLEGFTGIGGEGAGGGRSPEQQALELELRTRQIMNQGRRPGGPVTETQETFVRQGTGPATPAQQAEINRLGTEAGIYEEGALSARQEALGREQQFLEEQAGIASQVQSDLAVQAARDEMARRERQEAMARQTGKMDAALEEVAAGRIDPTRLFRGRENAGRAISSAIFAGLGAIGSALTGGPNEALAIIDEQIEQDIGLQREGLEQGWRALDAEGSVYDRMVRELGNHDAAAAATRALQLEDAARQIEMARAQAASDQAIAAADEMLATVRAEQAAAQQQAAIASLGVVEQRQQRRGRTGGASGGTDRELARLQAEAELGPTPGEDAAAPIGGADIVDAAVFDGLSNEERRDVRNQVAKIRTVRGLLRDMRALREEFGAEAFTTEVAARYSEIRSKLVAAISQAEGAGALGDEERQVFERRIPDASEWSTRAALGGGDPILNGINALEDIALTAGNDALWTAGIQMGPQSSRSRLSGD